MHRGENNLLVLWPDHGHIFARERIGQSYLFEERVDIVVAQRVLRELFEIVEPCLRVGKSRSGVISVASLHHEADRFRGVAAHAFGIQGT